MSDSTREETRKEMTRLSVNHTRVARRSQLLERLLYRFSLPDRLDDNLNELMDALMDAIPCDAGSIAMVDPVKNDVYFAIARGDVAANVLKLRIGKDQGIVGNCMNDRDVVSVSDVKSDPRFAQEIAERLGFDTRSILAAPIVFRGQALGAIELINRKEGDEWLTSERELVKLVGRTAGTLVYMAHLIDAYEVGE